MTRVALPGYSSGYQPLSGAAGTVNIPAGAVVLGWAAYATVGGATVTIDAHPPIALIAGVPINGTPDRSLRGPAQFVFTGTAAYLIEIGI